MESHDGWIGGKAPRQWAMDIYREPDRQVRIAMLAEVPEAYRDWVKEYVTEWWNRKRR